MEEKNPYILKSEDLTVEIKMESEGRSFKEALIDAILSQRQNLPLDYTRKDP